MKHGGAVGRILLAAAIGMLALPPAVAARDAAFLDPGILNSGGPGDEAVKVEPKSEIDIGESSVGTARRTTLFFVNESTAPVKVEKVELDSDANVIATVTSDDCTKQGSIAPQSRCSVEVSVTPSAAGAWTVETLMTHNGAGRIARAKLTGKTSGSAGDSEKKETGLAITSKESNPMNFGDVAVNAKAVRSALMVNDSPDPITLFSIDVIEADNGLERLDQGCTVDMELKPGESCPVTLVWTPTESGEVSTDLIIRHSGRLGFAVIPVRGNAKGGQTQVENKDKNFDARSAAARATPPPPTADELEKATAGKIPPVLASALPAAPAKSLDAGVIRLIGTVGNRAVLLLPDGATKIAGTGDEIPLDDDKTIKIANVNAKSVTIVVGGKTRELNMAEAPELVARAAAQAKADESAASDKSNNGKSKKLDSSGTPSSAPLPPGSMPLSASAGKSISGSGSNISGASP